MHTLATYDDISISIMLITKTRLCSMGLQPLKIRRRFCCPTCTKPGILKPCAQGENTVEKYRRILNSVCGCTIPYEQKEVWAIIEAMVPLRHGPGTVVIKSKIANAHVLWLLQLCP
jgi:hypothetical protein